MIEGARRVGKSYIAEEFAKKEYDSYILINFDFENNEFKTRFMELRSNLNDLFLFLQAYYGVSLYERRSLIIFDEIQNFPIARQLLKFLVQDGRYDYIETGSLIRIKSKAAKITIPSEEIRITLYPMDFEEFLWAAGDGLLFEAIKSSFKTKRPMGQSLHRKALERFNQYTVVGGMPQAIETFLETNDYHKVGKAKKSILDLYEEDLEKAPKVKRIYKMIPSMLGKENKRFVFSSIGEGNGQSELESAFIFLEDACLINRCFNTREPNIGLKRNEDRDFFKCYFMDTGLLFTETFSEKEDRAEVMRLIALGKLEVNKGMLIENVVAEELISSKHKLFYYQKNSEFREERMEIDFLTTKASITSRHNIIPIEVKSSSNYKLSSLMKFQKKYKEYTAYPIVLHPKDLEEKDGILYLPLYMASFIS